MSPALSMTSDLDALVSRAREGDREAYDQLFAAAADRLLLFVRLKLGPGLHARVEPADVLQDVYLTAHEQFERFEPRGEGSFLAWLCGIARHRVLHLAEHFDVAVRRPVEADGVSRMLELTRNDRTGVVTAVGRLDARNQLAEVIEGLEDDQREVLLLRFFEGLSQARIAERLGRSSSAVQRSLAAALGTVGSRLGDLR